MFANQFLLFVTNAPEALGIATELVIDFCSEVIKHEMAQDEARVENLEQSGPISDSQLSITYLIFLWARQVHIYLLLVDFS